jgi:glycosyltransferase involved in cell wall biosynthesis
MQSSNQKLRILFAAEASFVNSGFGNYTRELLTRLHATNKYHIAEFASYGFVNDPRDKDIKWRYYANAVKDGDPRHQEYMSRGDNQFGRWRFDKVVLDFKPHVVIDWRDYWMSSYQGISPLRPYFNWVLMPTVDSAPQQESWIDTYLDADAIFTYSDWGAKVILEQSNNKINYIDTTRPGVDLKIFKPYDDIKAIKNRLGLPEDSYIIGTVMRNQKRKLFPELMKAFRQLLDEMYAEGSKEADKLYLYLHTSYPDAGWDLPELLKEHRLLNRVYFTYRCHRCGDVAANVYSHPTKICKKCFEPSSKFTSVTNGVDNPTLSDIYNVFDLYVQYAICEGAGMPQIEAAACGVPIATVNYSAMIDVINKLDAYPIKIGAFFKELETKAVRAYPDNNDLVKIIKKHIRLRPNQLKEKKKNVRSLAERYYDWDHTAKIWENFLDSPHLFHARRSWNDPPTYLPAPNINAQDLDIKNGFFNIYNMCSNNLKDISKMSTMSILDMCKDATHGFTQNGLNIQNAAYQDVANNISVMVNNHNQAERARTENIKFNEDFIKYAEIKESCS